MHGEANKLNTEKLELIYNMRSICEALMHDGEEAAAALFTERVKEAAALSHGLFASEDGAIMLDSLNHALYDHYQFCIRASFAECCHKNRASIRSGVFRSREDVAAAGIGILRSYRRAYAAFQSECDHLERARNQIREHISDKLTLESVSAAINISPSYLSRTFSAAAGMTFCDYVRDERMALACRLLRSSRISIDEVSERCGFSTPNYFSTVFKKCIGQAPAAYRAQASAQIRRGAIGLCEAPKAEE